MRRLTAITAFLLLSLPVAASAGPPARMDQPAMPEPSAIVVFALGVAVVGGAAWRRRKRD
jgi:hypothetical protein